MDIDLSGGRTAATIRGSTGEEGVRQQPDGHRPFSGETPDAHPCLGKTPHPAVRHVRVAEEPGYFWTQHVSVVRGHSVSQGPRRARAPQFLLPGLPAHRPTSKPPLTLVARVHRHTSHTARNNTPAIVDGAALEQPIDSGTETDEARAGASRKWAAIERHVRSRKSFSDHPQLTGRWIDVP